MGEKEGIGIGNGVGLAIHGCGWGRRERCFVSEPREGLAQADG